ncbi:MAG: hypothetical protein NT178_09355 [Proteobacteria bacterium]|nr:hypothetical protein [Pseudomonadota bacterium]
MDSIKTIQQFGKRAQGRGELIRHLKGERLTRNQAIKAKCYDCMGGFNDGIYSCEIPECSLFNFMPYKTVEPPVLSSGEASTEAMSIIREGA